MNFLKPLIFILLFFNTLFSIYLVFKRPRSIATTWAWLILLNVLPVLGFLLYAFFGRGLAEENLMSISAQKEVGLDFAKKLEKESLNYDNPNDTTQDARLVIDYFNYDYKNPLSKKNDVNFFTDGASKFKKLFKDIIKAKYSVHVEYYTFYDDAIGHDFITLLEDKAREGVEVKLIYDPWGSVGNSSSFFDNLERLGGIVVPFITSRNMIRKYRLNYHLHRKIVVIDGQIGWTGGFNVGDQYLGRKKKFGYWRDTHVRIVGPATLLLQERFVLDFNASVQDNKNKIVFRQDLFPNPSSTSRDNTAIQIVSDGPEQEEDFLKNGVIRLMNIARHKIWIQTPYLVPDDSMISTLVIAARSGIDVKIMIPCKPDHPFIYRATQYYANYLTKYGIEIYIYNNGFLHAKTVIVDDKFATVGSMNQDFRSYMLNFEANAFFYDKKISRQLSQHFKHDMKDCTLLTQNMINQQSQSLKLKQQVSRLLSPIL
ncbi:cardiolipin synthase [Holzapfeliella floricola]|uniref:Cardiolipin synthase n=1 Tax=Holzapfeliella floricola DSM 23037 = JCM 16512 TaxID=1423744 RepID=A0A0R2DM75_9LACO|nr:cardiolipin synthase [Holzapfeliella floricola]KRN04774.1 phosphatidylserine phosphatidylglycerophosphate cardiolipin synthase-like protein [Holzapfeliella floricola DSM 23037 = JCM 16512]